MNLEITAKTNVKHVIIDFLEVRLKNGIEGALCWFESEYYRNGENLSVVCKNVEFDEINPPLLKPEDMTGMEILTLQTYDEDLDEENLLGNDVEIESLKFFDDTSAIQINLGEVVL